MQHWKPRRRELGVFISSVCLLLAGIAGCEPRANVSQRELQHREDTYGPNSKFNVAIPREEWTDHQGRVFLGSPSLVAGLPGKGPLQEEELQAWLDNPANHEPLDFALPVHLRALADKIYIPEDNPLTRAKIELGRQLFFDRRLSGELSGSGCIDCHPHTTQYTDSGIGGASTLERPINRAAPVVVNRIFSKEQFWDGRAESIEDQAVQPITDPHEMNNTEDVVLKLLNETPGYKMQFEKIFGEISFDGIGKSLASFVRTLINMPAPYDYWRMERELSKRDPETLDPDEKKFLEQARRFLDRGGMSVAAREGAELFFSDRIGCHRCHSGANFTDEKYHNLGLGIDEEIVDWGRFNVTGKEEDRGAFKTPTLRNVAKTGYYGHQNQLHSLEEAIDFAAAGGHENEWKSEFYNGFEATDREKRALLHFLQSLTGPVTDACIHRFP